MVTFLIGLFIGAFIGLTFTSILVMSRDDSEYASKRQIPTKIRI